jgi:hypothetical protein
VASFVFQNPVSQYAIGISAFQITYGADDHWLRTLMIKVLPVQGSAMGNQAYKVSVQVQIDMEDDSGNSANVANSFAVPVCIAVTKNPDSTTIIGSAAGISSGSSQSVVIPNGADGFTMSTCFQSGFNLSFTKDDHQLHMAKAGCGIIPSGSNGQISPTASLEDSSGNEVQVATVDAGYIVSSSKNLRMSSKSVQGQTPQPTKVTMDGINSISVAAAVIQSWKVQFSNSDSYPYANVHNVKTFTVGTGPGKLATDGNTVTIPQLYAGVCDASGNIQDNNISVSYCNVQVLAIP